MAKKDDKRGAKASRTDELIEQALKNLDDTGEEKIDEDGIVEVVIDDDDEAEASSRTKEQVAKIDVAQYVKKEQYMRLAADFDNFRRRAMKERQEWERQGREKILRELLDVMDNFARGLTQAESDEGALATGMRMIFAQCEQLLTNQGLERIQTVGSKFDPEVHDAVAKIEKPGEKDGTIIEELKRGYKWHDRLLRPASVVVVKNKKADPEETEVDGQRQTLNSEAESED